MDNELIEKFKNAQYGKVVSLTTTSTLLVDYENLILEEISKKLEDNNYSSYEILKSIDNKTMCSIINIIFYS